MELHNPDIAPEMRKSSNAAENQNERNMIQAALMMRYPEGDLAWSQRYARAFRSLFMTDDFVELVREAHFSEDQEEKNGALTRIQEMLEEAWQKNPDLRDDTEWRLV
ncbi:MAG: hypothetical protein WC866_04030 [Patescibacteria group bacterium]|jgi:hypothetical protein